MTAALIAVGVVVVLLALAYIGGRNRFVALRNLVEESWRQVDVELSRRHDLIPNLVETVKGYAAHERAVYEQVAELRSVAVAPGSGPAEQARQESALTAGLGRLLAVAEAYPELKANQGFLDLQRELADTEDRIAAARRFYNGNVRTWNTRIQTVPSSVIAWTMGLKPAEYFEADDDDLGVPRASLA